MLKRLTLATALAFASAASASAELYLGLRATADLAEGSYSAPFIGSWSEVIVDVSGVAYAQVQSVEALASLHGTVAAAREVALSNTLTAQITQTRQGDATAFQIIADPIEAISGFPLLDGFYKDAADFMGTDASLGLILPSATLVAIADINGPGLDVQTLKTIAASYAGQAPDALDDQVLGLSEAGFDVLSPATYTPTSQEILMSLGQDPENTLVVTLSTGDVVIRLRDDVAPNHTARIKELARSGFYDGIVFHRVIEGFMAQTGDPTGTGTSGSGQNLNAEFSEAPFLRGTVGMARAASPNSADSQFFIMFAEGRFLDNNYTVIGQVESGMEFVDQIKRGEPPVDPDAMIRVQVQADIAN